MKLVLCLMASFCLLAQAVAVPSQSADRTFLERQKSIYELFWHVDQPTVFISELIDETQGFNIENVDNYLDKEAINEFLDLLKHGMLPRGQVFTLANPELSHQAVILFRVLYSAKTFETFYKTAVWARFNINEMMFTYSLSVAVIHRPDTKYIKLPPLYEVLPNLFFNDDVMQKAYNIAMGDLAVTMPKTVDGVNHYVLPSNYSGWYVLRRNLPEQKLTYFTEDVGLNNFYFFINHAFPRFMQSNSFNLLGQIRGEYYFFIHKQLMARYYLERLSNDLGEIDYVSLHKPIRSGYYPMMHYRNGLPIPQRENDAVIPLEMFKEVQMLKDLHTRISTAIDLGFVVDSKGNQIPLDKENGVNILGNLIEGNADTINAKFYGKMDLLSRKIFGFGLNSDMKHQVVPSVLQTFSASLRDPVFFNIYKNILSYYLRFKETVPRYTREQLLFPGVRIESVHVDKLITYFDSFDSMLNNGLSIRNYVEAKNNLIQVRQSRLNHKPFTYHIVVNSDKAVTAMVRIFLGPKYDVNGHEIDLNTNYMNFLELDQFPVELTVGTNNIERSNHESVYLAPDETPSNTFYNKILSSIKNSESHKYNLQTGGFPDRLSLPKGKREGMTYKLFVVVSPLDQSKYMKIELPIWGPQVTDGYAMGFPLDRPVDSVHFFVPNMRMTDVVVYHKKMEELNINI